MIEKIEKDMNIKPIIKKKKTNGLKVKNIITISIQYDT